MAAKTKIESNDVMEVEAHHFITKASNLGWAPGYFPEQVDTELGNGLPFFRTSLSSECAKYRQQAGCIYLTVYND